MHCWLTSSKELAFGKSRRSTTAAPRKSRVLKEPTKKEEVLQTLEEEGARPLPWEICLQVASLCCDRQVRGMQQAARQGRPLAPERLLPGFPPKLSAGSSPSRHLPG